jgi:hypothetical protein
MFELGPIGRHDASDHRFGDAHEFHGHRAKGAHGPDGVAEKPILGEDLDHAPGQSTVTLPVFQRGRRGDYQSRGDALRYRHDPLLVGRGWRPGSRAYR